MKPGNLEVVRRRRPSAFFVAVVALAAGLAQWVANSPRWLVHINWDAASYLHSIASGPTTWSAPTWTAHAGLQYLYLLATWPAREVMGGTVADGFRLLAAFCFAATVATVAYTGARLLYSRAWGVLLASLWATAFVTQFLTFTLEDNLVFLVPASLLCAVCALRFERWTLKVGLASGLLAASALVLSLQALLYISLPLLIALFKPRRTWALARRLLDASIVLLGFALGLAAFVVFYLLSSSGTSDEILTHLFTRPTSTFPETKTALLRQLFDVASSLRTVGIATSLHLFQNRWPWTSRPVLVLIGALTMALLIGVAAATGVLARRTRRSLPLFFATVLLGLTVLTSVYRDADYAYLKRTDFVPLVVAFLIPAVLQATSTSIGLRRAIATTLSIIIVCQLVAGLRWREHEVASYETLDRTIIGWSVPGYHGLPPEGSFLRHYRALRAANPHACRFVFDLSEVKHSRWNPDQSASIWSELPGHAVLVSNTVMRTWPRPLVAWNIGKAKGLLGGCDWVSPEARKRLAR